MLEILGYLLLIGLAIFLIKFCLALIIRCCAGGILAFFCVGCVTGAFAIFGVINGDTAWNISKWAFYIGTVLNIFEVLSHPFDVLRECFGDAGEDWGKYQTTSNPPSNNNDSYSGMHCCANCRWNASPYPNNVCCSHIHGDAVSVTGRCSDYCEK